MAHDATLTNIRLFVNIRASYADEVNTMLSFFSNQLRLTRVSAYYQNESISVAGFKSANLSIAFNLLGLKVPASIENCAISHLGSVRLTCPTPTARKPGRIQQRRSGHTSQHYASSAQCLR